jgi:hypothetical protein
MLNERINNLGLADNQTAGYSIDEDPGGLQHF